MMHRVTLVRATRSLLWNKQSVLTYAYLHKTMPTTAMHKCILNNLTPKGGV